jgi:hypothetical protein
VALDILKNYSVLMFRTRSSSFGLLDCEGDGTSGTPSWSIERPVRLLNIVSYVLCTQHHIPGE